MQEVTRIWEAAADVINKEHRLARESAENAVDHAIRCGQLLFEKKKTVPHGEWMSWIDNNCEFSERQARRYMFAAKRTLASNLTYEEKLALGRDIWGHTNHRAQGTGENEWYTPKEYVEAARKVLGSIDLDPASSNIAQKIVNAKKYFTIDNNGLDQSWIAETLYLNPPYSQPAIWDFIDKLVTELVDGNVDRAILLTHNYTDTAWFHRAEELASAICFTRGRIKFVDTDDNECAPTQGQAFFYFGEEPSKFSEHFLGYGFIR